MSKNYTDFKNHVLTKGWDIDGFYGRQCWDGYAYYCKWLGIPFAHCTVTGYVRDIWEQRHTNGILSHCTEVSYMQPGDIAVFKISPSTPYSHIAIFDHDAGGGYGCFLGQNQGATGGNFNIVKLPYSATYATAFRPKALTQTTTTKPTQTATNWDQNAILKVGDRVKSVSCAITGYDAKNDWVKVPALGGWVPCAHVSEAGDTKDGKKDGYLANLNAKVYLDECTVEALDTNSDQVKVHGYWVNAGPLMAKR